MPPSFVTLSLPFGEGAIHPVVFFDETAMLLADCGYPGAFPALLTAFETAGLTMNRLTHLFLTHHDHDHMGTAAECKRRFPHLQIVTHALEAPYVDGTKEPLRLKQAKALQQTLPEDRQASGLAFMDYLRTVEPVSPDRLIQDGDTLPVCGGIQVLHTPGHTAGHCALLSNSLGVIAAGDAAVIEHGVLIIANPEFAENLPQAEASLSLLLHTYSSVPTIACCHGGLWTRPQPHDTITRVS